MRIRPETFADRGCWISDDRIYAFVSAPAHGVSEIGYHGQQPVSRNSRLLVHPHAVLECSLLHNGNRTPIPFDDLEWRPGGVDSHPMILGRQFSVGVRARSRTLELSFSPSPAGGDGLLVRFPKDALFTDVHGERTWEDVSREGNALLLSCRDRILFNSWIRRSGPYRGDFLIPEHLRRKLFHRQCRSGDATFEDVRPEYRDAPLPIYDARTWIRIGGEGFSLDEEKDAYLFTASVEPGTGNGLNLTVRCADEPLRSAKGKRRSATPEGSAIEMPPSEEPSEYANLHLPGYPHLEAFFGMVPPLVNSCIIRDYGVPRATPGRYYWIWAWDLLVSAAEMLRWGDVAGARRAVDFVTSHRDEGGGIPARWTRKLEPLDTPDLGAALEFLLAHLAYLVFLETGSVQDLQVVYPALVKRFHQLRRHSTPAGLICGTGFYPDLPGRFGRSASSAVAMETGSWYGFCRTLQNMAGLLGDAGTEETAAELAATTASSFLDTFWDPAWQCVEDAVDVRTGIGNGRHPLFSFLFLQSPLAVPLVRGRMQEIARFIARDLLTEHGLRTVPLSERGDGNEVVLDAWYPHWDLYALKLLRRAGDEEGIRRWLALAESALERLGYCPEYLSMKGFRDGDPGAWLKHGAPSNLNCVTGWYRGILEGVLGLDFDAGGLTLVCTPPSVESATLIGLCFRGAIWDVELLPGGPELQECTVDGHALTGCRKIPLSLSGPGRHLIRMRFGQARPRVTIEEITNCEVLEIQEADPGSVRLRIRSLGPGELVYSSPGPAIVRLDGEETAAWLDPETGRGVSLIRKRGEQMVELTQVAVRGSVGSSHV